MKLQEWFSNQNMFVKSLLWIAFIWGLVVYVPGTIEIVQKILSVTAKVTSAPAGSPIIVSGGSLYGTTTYGGWYPASDCDPSVTDQNIYCAPLPNGDSNILTSGGFSSSITNTDGTSWKIHFTDTDGKNENANEGIWLCSNATCNTADAIDLKHAYIKLYSESDSEWWKYDGSPAGNAPGYKLYFHDHSSDSCKPTNKHGGPCDVLAGALVYLVGSKNPVHYICTAGPTNCWVVVGEPEQP